MAIAIAAEDDLFCYFMEYHPYYGGKNPKHSRGSDSQTLAYLKDSDGPTTPAKRNLLKRISEWLEYVLDNLDTPESSENSSQSLDEETIEDTNPSKVKDIVIAIALEYSPESSENSSQSLDEENIKDTSPSKVKDIVIAIAPGHSPKSPENFVHEIVGDLIGGKIKDGRDLLKRTRKVPKAAHGGPRDQSLQRRLSKLQIDPKSRIKWSTLLMMYGPLALPFELVQV